MSNSSENTSDKSSFSNGCKSHGQDQNLLYRFPFILGSNDVAANNIPKFKVHHHQMKEEEEKNCHSQYPDSSNSEIDAAGD
jgi:hypothetical protein